MAYSTSPINSAQPGVWFLLGGFLHEYELICVSLKAVKVISTLWCGDLQ